MSNEWTVAEVRFACGLLALGLTHIKIAKLIPSHSKESVTNLLSTRLPKLSRENPSLFSERLGGMTDTEELKAYATSVLEEAKARKQMRTEIAQAS